MKNDNELKNMIRRMKKLENDIKLQKNQTQDLRRKVHVLKRQIAILQLGEIATHSIIEHDTGT